MDNGKKIPGVYKNQVPELKTRLSVKRVYSNGSPLALTISVLLKDTVSMVALAIVFLLILISVAAPLLAPHNPIKIYYEHVMQPPNAEFPFGTDDLGRDILSRVIFGGRESLRTGYLAVMIGVGGGVTVGLLSGYFGGVADILIQRIVEILLAFPAILLILSLIAALGPSLFTVMIAIGFANIPGYTRLMRGSVLEAKNFDYVIAAKLVGARDLRIMFRHIFPNIIAPVIVYATIGLGGAIMLTAGLSYLGLGAQPPSPEWGAMLNWGRSYLNNAWWMSAFPGLAVFIAVLSINVFGDGLQDALNPKNR
jgi:peptide/nickel transport system permease protein